MKINALKIFAQIILICFVFGLTSFAHAELQGKLYGGNGIVTEDGESFNIDALFEELRNGNIDSAEKIYNEWVMRRQEMLKNGTEFGLFDLFIKDCRAWILYNQKKYEECIAAADEILDYLYTTFNEETEKKEDWIYLIYNNLRRKKLLYDELQDYASSLQVQKDLVEFLSSNLTPDDKNLLKEKMYLSSCHYNIKNYKTAMAICEELIPQFKNVFGEKSNEFRDLKLKLAEDYKNSSRYTDAAKLYEEVLKSDIDIYGETDEKTLYSYKNLISMYYEKWASG